MNEANFDVPLATVTVGFAESMQRERAALALFPAVRTTATQALHRLLKIERVGSGQSARVARFLLALHNGMNHPFNFADLRFVDREIFEDCINILKFDNYATGRVEDLIPYGDAVMTALGESWGILPTNCGGSARRGPDDTASSEAKA